MASQPPKGPYPSYYLSDPAYPPHFYPQPPHGYPPPPHGYPPPPGHLPPPPPFPGHPPPPPPHGYPYYMPGAFMIPISVPTSQPSDPSNPTYITNYIYHGASEPPPSSAPAIEESEVKVEEFSGEYQWVPATSTTASFLTERAVVGGHEGWDGSPLWVIRSWHGGELVPGKLSIKHNLATIPFQGKEATVQNIEVLCAKVDDIRWVPATNGNVPPGAIPGGNTASGETLYVGRARYQLSLTPGKVQPSQNCCYISFSGAQVMHKMYDVLCRSNQ